MTIRAARERWWAAVRGAGPARLTYEIGLALLLGVISAVSAAGAGAAPALLAVVVAVTALVLVPLRLVYPAGAFAAATLAGTVTGGQNSIVLMVLGIAAGYRMTRLWRTAAAFTVGLLCVGVMLLYEGVFDLGSIVFLVADYLVFAVLPGLVALIVGRRRRLVTAMHTRNVQLHDQQAEVARRARERERTRIARDLHDSLGHQLTLISLYSGTLATADEAQRRSTVELLRATSAAAMGEMRQILGILHEEDGGQRSVAQPLSSLDDLITSARSTGAEVVLHRDGDSRPLAPMAEHAAYRVIQEGVTNALRHARGGAVQVSLRYEPDALIAEVVNEPGRRHDGPTSGQGLIGLGERIRLAGGVLYHGRTPDGRFRIAAMLPYDGQTSDGQNPDGQPPAVAAAGDYSQQMYRSVQRSRIGLIAAGVGVAAVAGLCGGVLILGETVLTVDRDTYDAATVGQREDEARDSLPDPDAATVGAVGGGPAPAGATCVDYPGSFVEQLRDPHPGDLHYRFCFARGVLAAKQIFYEPEA
ncbi:sensor histidine kinase [Actinoplanes sp. NPDC051494]|uniref:sensor histidine kinase n=1 Tax=Actinoplanes sp. NPDC051494 TaxID=3363907 RepID=UPI003798260B